MTEQHPITPPPELFKQWESMPRSVAFEAAYRAGADQELEACCEWLSNRSSLTERLRADRRPKPPSLKEQALDGLQRIETNIPQSLKEFEASCDVIRRALEQLDD